MFSSKETLMLSCFSCAGPIFKSRLKNTGCIHHEMPCAATLNASTIHRGEEGGTPADLRKPLSTGSWAELMGWARPSAGSCIRGPGPKLWDMLCSPRSNHDCELFLEFGADFQIPGEEHGLYSPRNVLPRNTGCVHQSTGERRGERRPI